MPGPIVHAERTRLGWSQADLAQRAGTTAATVSRIETGVFRGRPDTLAQIAQALGIDSARLIAGMEDESTSAPQRQIIRNRIEAGVVRGTAPARGASDDTAALARALRHVHLNRSGRDEHREIEIAGIPPGADLAELVTPIEVRVGGELVERFAPGWLFVIADAEPLPGDLVVAERPASDERDGKAQIRRYEEGPRGIRLLFDPASDEFVREDDGWRVAGVVIDKRPPPRS